MTTEGFPVDAKGSWRWEEEGQTSHVFPCGDLRPHLLEFDEGEPTCWCAPLVEFVETRVDLVTGIRGDGMGRLVMHNALDGRERYETGELELH